MLYTTRTSLPLDNGRTLIKTAPTGSAVLVVELQSHLRIEGDEEYLETLGETATEFASRYLRRSILETELVRAYDLKDSSPQLRVEYQSRPEIILPYGPIKTVDRVYTIGESGAETDITEYYLDDVSVPERIFLQQLRSGRELSFLRVEYTAGYEPIPATIKHGILMHAAYLYERRGECDAQSAAVQSGAIDTYRHYKAVCV